MLYLLSGEDNLNKNKKIEEIKKEYLTSSNSLQFDYDILHAVKLDPATFKEALYRLPLAAKKRVVILRQADALKKIHHEILLEFVQKQPSPSHLVLILDFLESDLNHSFLKEISPYAKVAKFSGQPLKTVFDMTNCLSRRDLKEALKILNLLITDGIHPLQMMGALIWHWKNIRPRLTREKFCRGLEVLEEADLNIKRSRLDPQTAVEVALVKLDVLAV